MAKTIVFCVDSEHADQMRQALNNANADLARQYPNYVARIVSDEGQVGREHLGNFADPQAATPVIATTSKLLSTGVDLPTVKNIVLFKPIGSMVDFKQIVGRGTRLFPDEDKLTFEIIDYSGATASSQTQSSTDRRSKLSKRRSTRKASRSRRRRRWTRPKASSGSHRRRAGT